MLSVIVPTLEEGDSLAELLGWLTSQPGVDEVVVVDASERHPALSEIGGAAPLRILSARIRGRGAQMNQGARACQGDQLLFLHADSRPPREFPDLIGRALRERGWGRFDLRLDNPALKFRLIARMINLRSRFTTLATGDQGIFVRRDLFESLDGFAEIALMEDVEFSRRAAAVSRPALIPDKLMTSARRWQQHGTLRTILLMWRLRYLYWRGTDPAILATMYRDAR